MHGQNHIRKSKLISKSHYCSIVHLSNHVTCCTQFRNNLINVILPIKVIINLNTKKFKHTASSMYLTLRPMDSAQYGRFFVTNFNIFVFSRFRTNLLAENPSIIRAKTRFAVVENSMKFLLEL